MQTTRNAKTILKKSNVKGLSLLHLKTTLSQGSIVLEKDRHIAQRNKEKSKNDHTYGQLIFGVALGYPSESMLLT